MSLMSKEKFKEKFSMPGSSPCPNGRRRSSIAQKIFPKAFHLTDKVGHDARTGFSKSKGLQSLSAGKFLINAKFPPTMEKPLTDRNFEILPSLSRGSVLGVLKENGIAAINSKGLKCQGDTSIGQDALSVCYLGNGWWLHVVADGHGVFGDKVSSRVMLTLPHFMNSEECTRLINQSEFDQAFKIAFRHVQEDIESTLGALLGDALNFSGTTCVCVLGQCGSSMFHVAHVGDSKAIMIHPDGSVLFRTEDHKPDNIKERQRCEAKGCEVLEIEFEDGQKLTKLSIKGEGKYPAISFSRSFGDQGVKEHGVHAIPEVSHWEIDSNNMVKTTSYVDLVVKKLTTAQKKGAEPREELSAEDGYVLIASDGIWEFMEPEEVGLFVATLFEQGLSGQETLNQLVLEARDRWIKNEGEYCDDITAIIVPNTIDPVKIPQDIRLMGCCAGLCKLM